jgi:hypothetical protein
MATRDQLLAFLQRPWHRLRVLKDRHHARVIAKRGADAAFHIAGLLRAHARAMGAAPPDAERRDDLATAVRLRKLLDRAGRRATFDRLVSATEKRRPHAEAAIAQASRPAEVGPPVHSNATL